MSDTKTYSGACHCKQNTFSVTLSPPLDNENNKVVKCNCSICDRNGYLLAFTGLDALEWTAGGLNQMKRYNFGSGKLSHYFCPNCGTSICATGSMGGNEMIGINTRVLDDVDLEKLHIRTYDGKSL